jgi:hypothetical protein
MHIQEGSNRSERVAPYHANKCRTKLFVTAKLWLKA